MQYEHAGRKWMSLQPLYRGSKYYFSACFAKNVFSSVSNRDNKKSNSFGTRISFKIHVFPMRVEITVEFGYL